MSYRGWMLSMLFVVGACADACGRGQSRAISLSGPIVELGPRLRKAKVDQASVGQWSSALASTYENLRLASAQPGQTQYRLAISAILAQPSTVEPPVVMVRVRAISPEVERPVLESAIAMPMRAQSDVVGATRKAVEQACRELFAQVGFMHGPEQPLLVALKGNAAGIRLAAVRVAALRKTQSAVPLLMPLLSHDDSQLRDAVLGALFAIGDRRAVSAITKSVKLADPSSLAKVIDGLAKLGGTEARSFLQFIAEGHEDVEIQDLAEQALKRTRK